MDSEQAFAKHHEDNSKDAFGWDPALLGSDNEHPSAQIPFAVIIDRRQFTGRSLSVLTAFASGLAGPELDGKTRIVVLRFDFNGYSITLPVDARISLVAPDTGELRLDFCNPTGEHLPTLRYLLNSYIAGETHSVGQIISQRGTPTGQAKKPAGQVATVTSSLHYFAGMAAAAAATVALAAVVANLAYARVFSSEVPRLATVSGDGEVMRALASGQISFVNDKAAKGDVIYALRSTSGDTLNVTMPCDCRVLPHRISEGATVLAGDPVVEVVQSNSSPVVVAAMPGELAKSLVAGNVAELRFADGTIAYAHPVDTTTGFGMASNEDLVTVRLAPSTPIPTEKIGTPVSVRIVNASVLALKNRFF